MRDRGEGGARRGGEKEEMGRVKWVEEKRHSDHSHGVLGEDMESNNPHHTATSHPPNSHQERGLFIPDLPPAAAQRRMTYTTTVCVYIPYNHGVLQPINHSTPVPNTIIRFLYMYMCDHPREKVVYISRQKYFLRLRWISHL